MKANPTVAAIIDVISAAPPCLPYTEDAMTAVKALSAAAAAGLEQRRSLYRLVTAWHRELGGFPAVCGFCIKENYRNNWYVWERCVFMASTGDRSMLTAGIRATETGGHGKLAAPPKNQAYASMLWTSENKAFPISILALYPFLKKTSTYCRHGSGTPDRFVDR